MNLLIVTPIFPPEIGGPATYTYALGQRLITDKVTIIAFGQQLKQHPKAHVHRVPLFLIPGIGTLLRQLSLALLVGIHGHKADLIYIQGPVVVGVTSLLVAKIMRKPTLLKFVGDIVWETARRHNKTNLTLEEFYDQGLPFIYKLLNYFQEFSLATADALLTPSQYLRDFLHDYHHVSLKKIKVVSNAIEVNIEKRKKKIYQIITVGRLVSWKNIDQIIKAVVLARKENPWQLAIVGDGPLKKKLQQLVKQQKASSYISFKGSLSKDETHQLIARSQMCILYSDYEGMPHVLIEAMMLGTSVIASDIEPNKEVLQGFGTLVPLKNPQLLATAINTKHRKITEAKRYADRKFGWSIHINKLSGIMSQLKS